MKKLLSLSFNQSIGGHCSRFKQRPHYSRIYLNIFNKWRWTPFIWVSKERMTHGIAYNQNIFKFVWKTIKQIWNWEPWNREISKTISVLLLIIMILSITLFFKQEKISRLANTIKVKEWEKSNKDAYIDCVLKRFLNQSK
jgi:hypothetical protein